MLFGAYPFGSLSFAEIPDAGTPNAITQAWEADLGRAFLYEVTAYQRGTSGSWIPLFGADPFGSVPASAVITGETVFRFSDVGYISKPTDALANTNFDGSISAGLRMTRTTPATPEASRRVTIDVGAFSIANGDGELDATVRGYSVDGRLVRVLLGLSSSGYGDFTPVLTGRMVDWSNDLNEVTVTVRDAGYRLETPMQTDLYGGTGGYDGGADRAGKPRPIAFGKCREVPAPLIEAATLTYQVHHREIQAVDAVYDRGAALTADADYASYALLAAASITTGHYATCLAKGLFRLGSTPSGMITADIRGDAHGGYVDTTGLISQRIAKDFGLLADSDLDLASWSNFNAALPGTIGRWWGTEATNVSDALDSIFGHCAGWWGATPAGLFQVGRLAVPTTDSYVLDIAESDLIDDLEILPPLTGVRFRQRVGYQRLWSTQQDTDLAGAVTAARRAYLAQELRVVASTDAAVLAAFRLAADPDPLPSLFDSQADAQSLADGLLALYKAFRQAVRVKMNLKGLGPRLSATVLITHSRLNGGAPTPMLVMDITIIADDRQVELVLWG